MMTIKVLTFLPVVFILSGAVTAQTLQQVTDNGNLTNRSILASSFITSSASFSGATLPSNISLLNGLRINGDIGNSSYNGITYQSGGGGGAAISFSRGGSYDTHIDFFTNSANVPGNLMHRMRINWQGNVGIGTNNPRASLDLGGDAANGKLNVVLARLNEGDHQGDGTFLGVRGYNTTDDFGRKSFGLEHSFYGIVNSSLNFFRGGDMTGGVVTLNTGTNLERLRIDAHGNVGIGTTVPNAKLAVNGNIRAHEIKVETANWPDYVFAKDYKLPTLEETEKYILSKGHLPDIPSATEAQAGGVNLGDMNKKLLQKIEEITLYLIELKKENQEIKNELNAFKNNK